MIETLGEGYEAALEALIREANDLPDLIEIALTYAPGEAMAETLDPWACILESAGDGHCDEFTVRGATAAQVLMAAVAEIRRRWRR